MATLITEPMLASAVAALPGSSAMPGGSAYEPKWDGYRGLVHHTEAGCRVISRRGNNLTAYFPDIADAVCSQLPPETIVDGELVIWRGDRIDFTALGERLTAPGRCPDLPREHPATFMAFDALPVDGFDLTGQPLQLRRTVLENWQATGAHRCN